ncbi:hypothetical protein E2C01_040086 [Portunus trituberculatus]|uniref:Uncharacterized protein n=1 Tax=Portunus trituberculatus TaxID=210409 RepID=A0A5B7FM09_PORTR|nr:hypothetical protein [Portunus trituberculatus]
MLLMQRGIGTKAFTSKPLVRESWVSTNLPPMFIALAIAELVIGTFKFGTLLGSLILSHICLALSEEGWHLRLRLRMEARHSDKGSPNSSSPWKWPANSSRAFWKATSAQEHLEVDRR